MKRTSHRFSKRLVLAISLLFALSALYAGGALAEDAPFTNADVLKMSKADLGNELIVAKIKQAGMVDFNLETDDIIELKGDGVSQKVIAAMLERTTSASSGGDEQPTVTLVTATGSTVLKPLEGDHSQFAAPFVGLRHFYDFDGTAAEVRTTDRQPTLELRLNSDPSNHWWIVELEPDNDDPVLGLDLESAGNWGGAHTFEPDEDQIIDSDLLDAGSGLWRFTPEKKLKPGEYGLYSEKGFVYEFGVDK